jgi:hypothetical protein
MHDIRWRLPQFRREDLLWELLELKDVSAGSEMLLAATSRGIRTARATPTEIQDKASS